MGFVMDDGKEQELGEALACLARSDSRWAAVSAQHISHSPIHRPASFFKMAMPFLRQLAIARDSVAVPTPAQAEAGNYSKGHIRWAGLQISIENPKGSTRSGTSRTGKKWSNVMQHDYGYVRGTVGKDKDHVDIFFGPDHTSEMVYVVDQQDPATGLLDEHKCLVNFANKDAARAGYLGNYAKDWQGLKNITGMTVPQFKWWLANGNMHQPAKGCLLKAAEEHVTQALRRAKTESDRRNFVGKHQILRKLLLDKPDEFGADEMVGKYRGLTHKSGFKIHAPQELIPDTVEQWQKVAAAVQNKMRRGKAIQRQIATVAKALPPLQSGYGQIFWHPTDKAVWVVTGDGDETQDVQRWHNALKSLHGVTTVRTEAEYFPPNREDWVQIKKANGPFQWLGKPFELAGKLTGGPTPLSNALAGGLLAGGLGYGAGALADAVSPDEYLEPGFWKKRLGLLGVGAGAAIPMMQAYGNHTLSTDAKQPLGWRSLITPDKDVPLPPNEGVLRSSLHRGHLGGGRPQSTQLSQELATLGDRIGDVPANTALLKAAEALGSMTGVLDSRIKPVAVDAFNNAIWHDVSLGLQTQQPGHASPAIGAAASGLVSGVQQMYGGTSLLSPAHFISGLAAAGVDGVTAHVAGGMLGALGLLTPKAQQTLQHMGVWGGMIRGVTGSVLGLY